MTRPNIIHILFDDLDDVNGLDHTPQIKALRKAGARFTNSFTTFAVCAVSRVSFLRGQMPHNHGVLSNEAAWTAYAPMQGDSLPAWLRSAGYATWHVGKLMNGYEDAPSAVTGFDAYHLIATAPDPFVYLNPKINSNGTVTQRTGYVTDLLRDHALDLIAAAPADRPFYLQLWPTAPHGVPSSQMGCAQPRQDHDGAYDQVPMPVSANFNEADVSDKPAWIRDAPLQDPARMERNWRKRRETMLAGDELVGAVRAAAPANTVIIVSSDNGFSNGAHRIRAKENTYDEGIRVPLIMAGPGVPVQATRDELVVNLDVAATICDLAQATPAWPLDGRSLMPLLNDTPAWRTAFLTGCDKAWAIRSETRLYAELATPEYGAEREFYTLDSDSQQLKNKIGKAEYRAEIADLAALLATQKTATGSNCWVS